MSLRGVHSLLGAQFVHRYPECRRPCVHRTLRLREDFKEFCELKQKKICCEKTGPRRHCKDFVESDATTELAKAVADVERDYPLPRCAHGKALRDHSGEALEPSCGCRAAVPTKKEEP